MKKMLFMLVITAVYSTAMAQPKRADAAANNTNTGTASAEEVCRATMNFINEMVQHGYDSYKGDLYSETTDMLTIRMYNSNTSFPLAKRVLIEDTNTLQQYRAAEILMLEENTADETISSAMQQYYEQINAIFKACLEPNKFKYENPAYDPAHLYKSKATLSRELPSQSKSMFSNMQLGNTIVAEVHIEQNKNKQGGGYTNGLYIVFKRQ